MTTPPTIAEGATGPDGPQPPTLTSGSDGAVVELQTLLNEEAGLLTEGIVGLQSWAIPVPAAGEVVADLCGVPAPGEA